MLIYEMIVNAAQAHDSPITYPTLKALLLTTERRMVEPTVSLVETTPVNAYVATRGRGGRSQKTRHGVGRSNRGIPVNQQGYAPHNNSQR